jgi:hypothetical protein
MAMLRLTMPDVVVRDVLNYHILGSTEIFVATGNPADPKYLLIDTAKRSQESVPWK